MNLEDETIAPPALAPSPAPWENLLPRLEPCPCCNGVARFSQPRRTTFRVSCTGCGLATRGQPTVDQALAFWNRRQPAPPVPEMAGKFALVLYFETQADVEECAAAVQADRQFKTELRIL